MTQGLSQVKSAVIGALAAAGLNAADAFPSGSAGRYSAPVVMVGFRMGECRSGALGSYLGQQFNADTQTYREVYGMCLELTLSLDIYSPPTVGAAGCEDALTALHRAALCHLPSGLKNIQLKWEETAWDESTTMFRRLGSLSCEAYFTAEAEDSGVELTDFILKGVITK